MPSRPTSRTVVVYFTAAATDYAYFTVLFVITRLLAETGAPQWRLGLFGASASLSYALSGPLAGGVSDRFGRRRVMLIGAAVMMLVLLGSATLLAPPVFYVAAILSGICAGLIFPPLIAWLTEDGHDNPRRLFRFCVSWNSGVVAAQLSGGWLYSIRPELPLLIAAAPIAAVVILLLAWKPGESAPAPLPVEHRPAESMISKPEARTFAYIAWVCNVAGALSFSLLVHLFPYLAHESGIAPPLHGTIMALNRIVVIATYLLMYRSNFWHFRLSPAFASQVLAMVGLSIVGFSYSIPLLAVGVILAGVMLGYNYFASIYYSTVAFAAGRKGRASGVHEASLAFGGAFGALGGGIIGAAYGARIPYRLSVVVLAVFIAVQLLIRHYHGRRTSTA